MNWAEQSMKYISEDFFDTMKAGKIRPCDVLLVKDGATTGKVAYVDAVPQSGAAINEHVFLMRPKDNLLPKYLYFYLHSPIGKNKVLHFFRGAAIGGISRDFLNAEIKLPSISVQEEIIKKLSCIDDIVQICQQMKQEYDNLVKSRFVEMFGDPHHSNLYPYRIVKEFTNICSGGTPSRKIDSYWKEGTIRWVKTTELQNCVIYDTEEKITLEALEKSSAKLVPADTVLIAMYGQGKTRGMTGYLNVESTTNQACACILPSKEVNQKYLWRYFMMSYEELRGLAVGAGQPNLTGDMIKNFPVLMPPLELQEEYVAFAELADKSKLVIDDLIKENEVLRTDVMQQYFC